MVGDEGVLLLAIRSLGGDVNGRLDQIRNIVQQLVVCLDRDGVGVGHAQGGVDGDGAGVQRGGSTPSQASLPPAARTSPSA